MKKILHVSAFLIFLSTGFSYAETISVQTTVPTSKLALSLEKTTITNKTLAVRCYKRCYVDRWGRHCRTVCN